MYKRQNLKGLSQNKEQYKITTKTKQIEKRIKEVNIEEKLKNEMTVEQKLATLLSIDRYLNAGVSVEEDYYNSDAIMEDEGDGSYNVKADTKGKIDMLKEIRDEFDDLVIDNELEDFYDKPTPNINLERNEDIDIIDTYNGLSACIRGAIAKYRDKIEEEDWETGSYYLGKYKAALDTLEQFEDMSIENTMTIQQLRFLSLGNEIIREIKHLNHVNLSNYR